ncbi:hypothetical protein AB4090_07675 [Acidithiobacillus sp. IBUN Pt1247-S3]|uniref:hypothetical protein n=1 Tax=Acidithiobacillus sp. IBUN Pt1247-S3 TaxID=3166642 RepID=UPI0034E52BFD
MVGQSFFEGFDLNVAQVARGQADIDPAILDCGGTRGCLELGKFRFRCDGVELAFIEGAQNFAFVFIKFRYDVLKRNAPLRRERFILLGVPAKCFYPAILVLMCVYCHHSPT